MAKRASRGPVPEAIRARIRATIARLVEAGVDDLLTLERPGTTEADRAETIARLAGRVRSEMRLTSALRRALPLDSRGATELEAAVHFVLDEARRDTPRKIRLVETRGAQRRQGTTPDQTRPSDLTPVDYARWFRQEVRRSVRAVLLGGGPLPGPDVRPPTTSSLEALVAAEEAAEADQRALLAAAVLRRRASPRERELLRLTLAHPDWTSQRLAAAMRLKPATVNVFRLRLRNKMKGLRPRLRKKT